MISVTAKGQAGVGWELPYLKYLGKLTVLMREILHFAVDLSQLLFRRDVGESVEPLHMNLQESQSSRLKVLIRLNRTLLEAEEVEMRKVLEASLSFMSPAVSNNL